MKKRIISLLVAVLLCVSTATPIGAEESTTTYMLAPEGTIISVPKSNVTNIYDLTGTDGVKIRISVSSGVIQYISVDGTVTQVTLAQLPLISSEGNIRYKKIVNVDSTFRITLTEYEINRFTEDRQAVIRQILIPVGTEPEVTDPEPEVTDPDPEVTDPDPEVTDPDPEVTDPDTPSYDGINQFTQTIIQFWTNMVNSIYGWIAHPTYAIFDTQSPVFSVLALVFACGVTLTIFDKIFDFWRK